MTTYPLVTVPSFANKPFFDFNKNEAKLYLDWFLNIKNERMMILEKYVDGLPNDCKLDYTSESLSNLYEWFKTKIKYRSIDHEERMAIQKQLDTTPLLKDFIPIPTTTLTQESVSICFDVGIYLGDTLIKYNERLLWTYILTPKRYVYYAQPVITIGVLKFNPRASIEVIAREFLDNSPKQNTIKDLFVFWNKEYNGNVIK